MMNVWTPGPVGQLLTLRSHASDQVVCVILTWLVVCGQSMKNTAAAVAATTSKVNYEDTVDQAQLLLVYLYRIHFYFCC